LRLPGYVQRGVTLVPGKRQLPYLRGHGVEAVEGRVLVNAAHGRWVRTLLDRGVDVGWATTWEHYANEVFGPVLGLPPLPLAIEYRADVQNGHYRPRMDDRVRARGKATRCGVDTGVGRWCGSMTMHQC